jgi:hypothetical protein
MTPMSLGRDYLEIVLRLGKLVPGWVESYVGPPELAAGVDAADAVSAEELRESVETLAGRVGGEEPDDDRRGWLLAQLRAISTALRWFGGERLGYAVLFERCHGARVELVPDQQFERTHALLERALPGRGDVSARYLAWRRTQLVPRDRLQASLELLAGEMRRRCHELFDLPESEQVTWQLVSGEPWAGHAEYLGQCRTLVRINVDFPISSSGLLDLVCHEAYPGHHTEDVCKAAGLVQGAGREELAVYVYPTPQAVIAEGLACYAREALLGSDAEQVAADCLRPAGIPYDYETAATVREAEALLFPVLSNVALMLDGGTSPQQARDYARAWLLDETDQIDEAIEDLQAHSWRPYASCYHVGLVLCRQYAAADKRRFQDLLQRQLTPADLAQPEGDVHLPL